MRPPFSLNPLSLARILPMCSTLTLPSEENEAIHQSNSNHEEPFANATDIAVATRINKSHSTDPRRFQPRFIQAYAEPWLFRKHHVPGAIHVGNLRHHEIAPLQ